MIVSSGEERAWEILRGLDPGEVCRNARVEYDGVTGQYNLKSFGMDFLISARDGGISSIAPGGDILLGRLGYFFRLSVPWYLIGAKDVPLSGRLVKPNDIKGGQLFFRGTHMLPLDKLAARYAGDARGFLERGRSLGGEVQGYGDASFRFAPLPRMPAVMILWTADEEFPPRADLLLDSTCELHAPLDIIWSVAMMSILILF